MIALIRLHRLCIDRALALILPGRHWDQRTINLAGLAVVAFGSSCRLTQVLLARMQRRRSPEPCWILAAEGKEPCLGRLG